MDDRLNKSTTILLFSIIGIFGFIVLYVVATFYYPGGSQVDVNATGFSLVNNYWCNLLSDQAINGQPNAAQPFAVAGMLVLCVSLSLFWWFFPVQLDISPLHRRLIQFPGTLAMISGLFLFFRINHDMVTNIASFFGLIATVSTFIALFKLRWFGLVVLGVVNLVLVIVNNVLYYDEQLIIYLPVVQKITFACFLLWIAVISGKVIIQN